MISDFSSIIARIRSYILKAAYVENDKIKNDTLIFKEGYFDSMGFIRLITFIEEEFALKTVDEDLTEENFESINAIAGFISTKLQLSLCAE